MQAPRAAAPIIISVGTRPEIIKMAPLHTELRRRGIPVSWVHTGQHGEMADTLYRLFGIAPEHRVTLARDDGGLAFLNAELLRSLPALYEAIRPRAVLVHGDTTSTLASAQAAFYCNVPIGHVEAGLRTHQAREPFPEEKNRELTARLARWHFAPTVGAAANLAREGIDGSSVHVVGNTGVDAALSGCARLDALMRDGHDVLPRGLDALRLHGASLRLVTVTAHRRENWDGGIARIARAVARLLDTHDDLVVVWPVHGNPIVHASVHRELGPRLRDLSGRLLLLPPLDYPALLWCLRRSVMALTDSGGIQEEGAALSLPVLVLRDRTERPELIAASGGLLVGTDEERIVATVTRLLAQPEGIARMRAAANPFGDGRTAARIVDVLERDLAAPCRRA